MTERVAILLDRFPLWQEAVETLVTASGFFGAVELTSSPEEALWLLQRLRPELHVVGLDTFGTKDEGLAYLGMARDRAPHANILALSPDADAATIDETLRVGAFAYILKTAEADDLAAAIRQAFEPTIHFPGLVEIAATTTIDPTEGSPAAALTPREREVLVLAAEGLSNSELALRLLVSEKTVRFHLSNVYRKLGISNRTEASHWAQLHGLVQLVS